MKALFILLAACEAGAQLGSQTPAPSRAEPFTDVDGRVYAIVQLVGIAGEATNLGGNHFTFQLDEPGKQRFAHGGGHGFYGPSLLTERFAAAFYVRERGWVPQKAHYYVAELGPVTDKRDLRRDCLDCLPAYDFETYRVLPVRDVDDARRLLAQVVARGMPPITVIVSKRRGDLAVVRVRRRINEFSLEPVDGAASKELLLPVAEPYTPLVGDLLVVESTNGSVARLLVADDLASARRWAAAIRRDGWPAAAISVQPFDNLATSRFVMKAEVADGEPGCGPDLVANVALAGQLQLAMPRVAAPPGLVLHDSLLAVVVARFAPDPCKRTARAVRVYHAPPGMPDHAYQVPSGLVPIVE
jgi:hypothetical protein